MICKERTKIIVELLIPSESLVNKLFVVRKVSDRKVA